MSWADELEKIRGFLRDPNGLIWQEPFLRHLYNDCQQDFQKKTHVLEDVIGQRVPQLYHFAYQQDWEYADLPDSLTQFYQCLSLHDYYVACHRWEPQQITGIENADVADYGAHFTQPWEAYHLEAGEVVKQRFPSNCNAVKFMAYDEKPIGATTRKNVQSLDGSYINTQGTPIAYYPHDETDNSYVLYPRPSVAFQNDVAGEGVAFYEAGDTEDDDTGVIAIRDGSTPTGSLGASVDIIDTINQMFVVYDVSPNDVTTISDEPAFPEFLRKYIRYGVISRAYGANTDGRIQSLAEYWGARWRFGINCVRQFVRNRRQDRDYRLTTKGLAPSRRYRHPRLPDTYPNVNP